MSEIVILNTNAHKVHKHIL